MIVALLLVVSSIVLISYSSRAQEKTQAADDALKTAALETLQKEIDAQRKDLMQKVESETQALRKAEEDKLSKDIAELRKKEEEKVKKEVSELKKKEEEKVKSDIQELKIKSEKELADEIEALRVSRKDSILKEKEAQKNLIVEGVNQVSKELNSELNSAGDKVKALLEKKDKKVKLGKNGKVIIYIVAVIFFVVFVFVLKPGRIIKGIQSSISSKIFFVFVAFLVFLISSFVGTYQTINNQKVNGSLINFAGRERMLSQKIAKDLYALVEKREAKLAKTILLNADVFEKTLIALKDGGFAPIDLEMKDFQLCPKAKTKEIDEQLAKVVSIWSKYREEINKVVNFKDDSDEAFKYVIENNPGLLKEMNLAVSLMQANDEKTIQKALIIQFAVLLIGVIILLIMLHFLKRSIVQPIKHLSETIMLVGKGDLDQRVEISSSDELGSLSDSLNNFIEQLAGIIMQIKEAASQLSLATGEIANSSQQISDGAQQQSASFEELASSVQTNAENVKSANGLSQDVTVNAEKAGQAMDNTVGAMSVMEKSSGQIAQAVNIITDIADQTNLLALNAAIEAARAGEHGKGFAVVADEVRQLAERSASSAKDIANLIKETLKQVENGVNVSKEAGDNVKIIIGNIRKVAEGLQSIAHASEEQAAAMEQNTSITESNAAASEELASAAEEMATQASSLQDILSRFKVSKIATEKKEAKPAVAMHSSQNVFNWDQSYSVDVSEMDEQHKKLFNLINELYLSMKSGKTKENIGQIVDELVQYTKYHFGEEEKLMRIHKYPEIKQQEISHKEFVSKIQATTEKIKSGQAVVSVDLLNFLKDWLVKHIKGLDKKYGPYMKGAKRTSAPASIKPVEKKAAVVPPGNESLELISWSKSLSVGIDSMDEQHKKLVGMVNNLYSAMKQGKTKEALNDVLDQLIVYTATHFRDEEALMKRYNFPGLKDQENVHKELVKKVQEVQSKIKSGQMNVSIEVMNFLKKWLSEHICGMDKKYGEYINAKS